MQVLLAVFAITPEDNAPPTIWGCAKKHLLGPKLLGMLENFDTELMSYSVVETFEWLCGSQVYTAANLGKISRALSQITQWIIY
jgi:hypothetical protein